MTLLDLATYICTKVGQTDDDSLAAAKLFLRRRYRMIWDFALWKESLSIAKAQVPTWTTVCSLSFAADQVVSVRKGVSSVRALDQPALMRYDPAQYDSVGSVAGFLAAEPSCLAQPQTRTLDATYYQFQVTTGNVADVTQTLTVTGYGLDNNGSSAGPIRETLLLAGSTPVTSANSYAYVSSLTLDSATIGAVFFADATTSIRVATIAPGRLSAPVYPRINILGATASDFYRVLIKRRPVGLLNDGDEPELRTCDNALLALAGADMLERQRQYAKAQAKLQEGQAQMQLMLDLEKNQGANEQCLVPVDIHSTLPDSSYAFGAQGKGYW